MRMTSSRIALTRRAIIGTGLGTVLGARAAGAATGNAPEPVRIGAVLPLTGGSSKVGRGNQDALETAADFINYIASRFPLLGSNGAGLDGLGGAKIQLLFADHGGNPAQAGAAAERLITRDNVAALIGTSQSATAITVSDVAERHGIPFVSADNSSPVLHRRGLKWFFRTGPHDEVFTDAMFAFLRSAGARSGRPATSVALFYEDSAFGIGSSGAQRAAATQAGLRIAADIKYPPSAPSLAAEAQALRDADADVLLPSSYTADAILLMQAFGGLGYRPRVILAQAAGFQDSAFLSAAGRLAEGVFSRSSFASDALRFRPGILSVNEAFTERTGAGLNDDSARQVVALQVLAGAINRAGSTGPAAIHAALAATDLPGEETIMPWRGVRFDKHGQNTDATPVIQQVSEGAYRTVFPYELATRQVAWGMQS